MELKLRDVVLVNMGLLVLAKKDLSARLSFKIAMNLKNIEPTLVVFEEKRNGFVKKFGVEKDGICEVSEDKKDEFFVLVSSILDESVEIAIKTMDISEFDNNDVTAETLRQIIMILTDEKEK